MDIRVPEFGDGSVFGTVISWFVEKGSIVEKGQLLLEIELDKALLKIEAPVNGTVEEIKKSSGADVTPGEILLEIQEEEKAGKSEENN